MATLTMDYQGSRVVGTRTPVVLTARGRFIVRVIATALAAVLALGVLGFGKDVAIAALLNASMNTVASHSVVVKPGETLWQIAARELPGADTRDSVARIRTMNALEGRSIQAGQTLAIPAN